MTENDYKLRNEFQFRMQQDWLKKFKTLKATGGGIPPVPPHPNNLSSQQIQAMYNRLMEHIMIRLLLIQLDRISHI